jgi:hypothetical protein
MHLLIWTLAIVALLLWSLLAWAAYALLSIDPATFANVDEWVAAVAAQVPGAAALELWLPGWQAWLQALLQASQAVFGVLAAVGPWLVIVVWALGAVLLLGAAVAGSVVVRLLRGRRPRLPGSGAAPVR